MSIERICLPLTEWYDNHKRILPWRENPTAYHVWVSEIMLQQTRVEAVKGYYLRFLDRFPTVETLAEAKEEELLKVWEGLGYYRRVRNMNRAACIVVEAYNGELPTSYEELLSLPGIGSYTAGAIASIAYGIRVPAVDGNVLRVITRITGCEDDIRKDATKHAIEEELLGIIPQDAGKFNQALMELGATVCVPNGMPKCALCPIAAECRAFHEESYVRIPFKSALKERTIEERTLLILRTANGVLLQKRPARGLLAGMYELPAMQGHFDEDDVLVYVREMGFHPIRIEKKEDAKHIFTHKEWRMRAYLIQLDDILDNRKSDAKNNMFFADSQEVAERYPLPSAFSQYRAYL